MRHNALSENFGMLRCVKSKDTGSYYDEIVEDFMPRGFTLSIGERLGFVELSRRCKRFKGWKVGGGIDAPQAGDRGQS